jgi:putative transcriptional regulator
MRLAFGALVAIALLFGAPLAGAQDLSRPLLLVATPDLQGPYSHTAVLVVPMGDKHIGFILNRATDTMLYKAFPDHAPSAKVVDPIYFGGPEAADAIFALLRRNPGGPAIRLFGDLYMTGSSASIDSIIEQTPNDARYFAGFVGWLPEELAGELGKGYWYATEADADLVFQTDTGEMWEQLIKRLGKSLAPRAPGEREACFAREAARS